MTDRTDYEPPRAGIVWIRITPAMIREAEERAARERIREMLKR